MHWCGKYEYGNGLRDTLDLGFGLDWFVEDSGNIFPSITRNLWVCRTQVSLTWALTHHSRKAFIECNHDKHELKQGRLVWQRTRRQGPWSWPNSLWSRPQWVCRGGSLHISCGTSVLSWSPSPRPWCWERIGGWSSHGWALEAVLAHRREVCLCSGSPVQRWQMKWGPYAQDPTCKRWGGRIGGPGLLSKLLIAGISWPNSASAPLLCFTFVVALSMSKAANASKSACWMVITLLWPPTCTNERFWRSERLLIVSRLYH